jgi:hypothetical protein
MPASSGDKADNSFATERTVQFVANNHEDEILLDKVAEPRNRRVEILVR